ncbi:hypothetical protein Tco_0785114 [Tanacetum coccineum]
MEDFEELMKIWSKIYKIKTRMSIEINKKKEIQQLEQADKLSTYTTEPSRRFNYFYDDDDDYDDYDYEEISIPLRDIISKLPLSIAITPILLTLEPEDSLIMGNEELSTIPKKQSEEFIKSSTGGSFSNPNDDESLSDEDVPEDNIKIYSNPLFEFDDKYISSDVNPLFDEVLEDSLSKDSYVSNLDETALLVTPLSDDDDEDECFDPGGDVNEIELLLQHNISTPKMRVVSILEGFTDEPPLKENDDLFYLESKANEWKEILYVAPKEELITEDKVFDLGIHKKQISPTYVSLSFKDRHYLSFTYSSSVSQGTTFKAVEQPDLKNLPEISRKQSYDSDRKACWKLLTISPNVEVSFFKLLCTTDDIDDMTFGVYALPCYGLVFFVMALFIHAL